jgi:hypothetical protein
MSDNEAIGPAATSADDTSLPKATIAKLVTGSTPPSENIDMEDL